MIKRIMVIYLFILMVPFCFCAVGENYSVFDYNEGLQGAVVENDVSGRILLDYNQIGGSAKGEEYSAGVGFFGKYVEEEGVILYCGDGIKNNLEECDGVDLGGETCTSLGYSYGILSCSNVCNFVETSCYYSGGGSLLNVSEEENKTGFELLDIKLDLENTEISSLDDLVAIISFFNFGTIPVDVNFIIQIEKNGVVFYEDVDSVKVETDFTVRKTFENLVLDEGDYIIRLKTNYGDNIETEFTENFSFYYGANFFEKVFDFFKESVYIWYILFLVIIFIIIIKYRRFFFLEKNKDLF